GDRTPPMEDSHLLPRRARDVAPGARSGDEQDDDPGEQRRRDANRPSAAWNGLVFGDWGSEGGNASIVRGKCARAGYPQRMILPRARAPGPSGWELPPAVRLQSMTKGGLHETDHADEAGTAFS